MFCAFAFPNSGLHGFKGGTGGKSSNGHAALYLKKKALIGPSGKLLCL